MSDTPASLRLQINGAADLQSIVRTMKAVTASSIGQYENAVLALADYYRTVELGLSVCLRNQIPTPDIAERKTRNVKTTIVAVVFGSDQGLVGQFNEVIADHAVQTLAKMPGTPTIWTVGERVHARLADSGLALSGLWAVPSSIKAITGLVGQILVQTDALHGDCNNAELHLFYNRPTSGAAYHPVSQQLLPLDETWQSSLNKLTWPTKKTPEVIGDGNTTLKALIREYLFVSLFRACAESLASENASRLAAMQRADKNIDELLNDFNRAFHRLRQSCIDEELFDVISGFESLRGGNE